MLLGPGDRVIDRVSWVSSISSFSSMAGCCSSLFLLRCFVASLEGDGLAEGFVDFDSVPRTVLCSCFL